MRIVWGDGMFSGEGSSERTIDYNRFAGVYAANRRAVDRVVAHLVQTMQPHHPRDILEVGCGTANHLAAVTAALGGARGYGFDQSQAMLAEGARNYPGLQLKLGNAEEHFPFDPEAFDLVFGVDMVHYIKNLDRFLSEGLRVLRPGGTFVVVTWSEEDIRRSTIAAYFPEAVEADLQRMPGVPRLEQGMQAAGFAETWVSHTEYTYPFDEAEFKRFQNKAYTELLLIPEAAFAWGMERLTADYHRGRAVFRELYSYVWGRKGR